MFIVDGGVVELESVIPKSFNFKQVYEHFEEEIWESIGYQLEKIRYWEATIINPP